LVFYSIRFFITLVSFYELFIDVFASKKRKTRTTQEHQNGQRCKVEEKKAKSKLYIIVVMAYSKKKDKIGDENHVKHWQEKGQFVGLSSIYFQIISVRVFLSRHTQKQ
jgi:hypothetical protein